MLKPLEIRFLILSIPLAFIVFFLRAVPFIFSTKVEKSSLLKRLGEQLPMIIMICLSFNSVKNVSPFEYPYGALELIGYAIALILFYFKRNLVISLLTSFIIYLALHYV